jgi:hypothetical protein
MWHDVFNRMETKTALGSELMRVTATSVFFPAVALPNNKQLCICNKLLIIRPNTTYRYSIIVQRVSAVQTSLHQIDVGYTKRNMKGERK